MAIYCSEECRDYLACCDYCIYSKYDDGERFGPTGCSLHVDKEHQEIAQWCGKCNDFHCVLANKETGEWIEE